MSDSPSESSRKKPDRRGANLNLKRPADSRVNEEDLWNFDEVSPALQEQQIDEPEIEETTTAPEPEADPPITRENEEPITRIEPTYSKRRLRRNQRRPARDSEDEIEAFDELEPVTPHQEEPSLPAKEEPVTASAEIAPSNPVGLGLNEDELWGDFLDEEESDAPTPVVLVPVEKLPEIASPEPAVSPHPEQAHAVQELSPTVEESAETSPMTEELSQAVPESEMFDDPVPATAADHEEHEIQRPQPKAVAFSWKSLQFSQMEMITSGVFLGLLLLLGLWTMSAFRSQVLAQADPYRRPDLPVSGTWAQVESADTYWRAPVREGENADVVRREITLIPVIELTLGSCAAPSGVIRVIVYNDKGEIAGDTITRSYQNQQFTASGSNRLAFSGTTGFTDYGEQEAYRAHIVKPWTISVYEGPDDNAPSSAFKLLFSTPISTNIQ